MHRAYVNRPSRQLCYLCSDRHHYDMNRFNVFDGIPEELPDELTEVLLSQDNVRIERIVSRGHRSPVDFWYDQKEHEWVLVLAGRARVRFKESNDLVDLNPGDSLRIPAHTVHRVEWTDPDQETIWLAVFYSKTRRGS